MVFQTGNTDSVSRWDSMRNASASDERSFTTSINYAAAWTPPERWRRWIAMANRRWSCSHHMGVSLDATYTDTLGRPRCIVENGQPIRELL
jgi:hypothetical protein